MTKVLMFVAGATVGSVVSWYILKNKYQEIMNEAVASVKEMYARKYKNTTPTKSDDTTAETQQENDQSTDADESTGEKPNIPVMNGEVEIDQKDVRKQQVVEYSKIVSDLKYNGSEKAIDNKKGGRDMNAPYVIHPDDFDTIGYETESLTLYADHVLTNEQDIPIEDIDYLVGEDSLERFGEFEEDSVFVRNDELKTDFEILLDVNNYYDE